MNFDQVRKELVRNELRRLKLPLRGTVTDLAARLESHYQLQAAAHNVTLAQCDRCDGQSDAELPACPFCGDSEPVQAPSKEIVVHEVDAPASPLDEVVAELRECAQRHWSNVYRTGVLLRRIRDEELWKERRTPDGRLAYNGYLGFVEDVIGMKAANVTRVIKVVENYSQEEVGKWGIARLSVSTRLPVENRQAFLERTAEVPTRQLAAEATRERDPQADHPATTGPPVIAKVHTGLVTAPLWRRRGRASRVGVPEAPAISLEQRPWAQVQVGEDLWVHANVKRSLDDEGRLVLVLDVRKGRPIGSDNRVIDVEADGG